MPDTNTEILTAATVPAIRARSWTFGHLAQLAAEVIESRGYWSDLFYDAKAINDLVLPVEETESVSFWWFAYNFGTVITFQQPEVHTAYDIFTRNDRSQTPIYQITITCVSEQPPDARYYVCIEPI